jgi:hypothetical protein
VTSIFKMIQIVLFARDTPFWMRWVLLWPVAMIFCFALIYATSNSQMIQQLQAMPQFYETPGSAGVYVFFTEVVFSGLLSILPLVIYFSMMHFLYPKEFRKTRHEMLNEP